MIAWTIAGSDASGCAGIQADLKTFQNLGVHGCSIITAATAQNHQEITQIHCLTAESVAAQIDSLRNAFPPQAIKIGMLGNESILHAVVNYLSDYSGYVVFDPLIHSTSGHLLYCSDLKSQWSNILPLVDVVTPNIPEAEALLNCEIRSYRDMENSAREMLSLGAKSVLIKGGHYKHDFSQDYWTNGTDAFWLAGARHPGENYRGTGCILSSAITAALALGYDIKDAMVIAKMYTSRSIRLARSAIPAHHGWPEEEIDLPFLSSQPMQKTPDKFIDCAAEPLGLYPVVDSIEWLEKLLPLGASTLQLRIKNKRPETEIRQSLELAARYHARLFINDYWELALRYGAYGVHLGQEDLNSADINSIRETGLRLGVSTHGYAEVARAHALKASYLACGPIFPTTSKIMPFAPQGVAKLKRWVKTLNYPVVAIGGINESNMDAILETQVNGIAMISAITKAKDPVSITKKLLKKVRAHVT